MWGIIIAVAVGAIAASALLIRAEARANEQQDWEDYIEILCEERQICPELIESIIETESGWNPQARNGDCVGLMQISERWHGERMERLGVTDLLDPYDNILVGVDYLAELFERHCDVGKVLMIYNGDSKAWEYDYTGELSDYAAQILERSAQLERRHGK